MSCSVSRAVRKRTGTRSAVGAEPPGHLEAVEVGQHHVEDDEVGRVLLGLGQGLAAGHRLVDGEPLVAQRRRHRVDDRGLVVNHQDPGSVVGLHWPYLPDAQGRTRGFPVQCDPAVGLL